MRFCLVSIGCFFLLASCKTDPRKNASQASNDLSREQLIEINKAQVEAENKRIDQFVQRRKWEMTETGTGLRIMIYEQGDKTLPKAREGQRARIHADVSLLDGSMVYSTKAVGPQEFTIGMDNVESGLHEGILYMRVGDKAKLVLPPHLAHGLVGDQQAIPGSTTIIYDLELVALQ